MADSAEDKGESTAFGVSIRAWTMIVLVGTVVAIQFTEACAKAYLVWKGIEVETQWVREPLYGLVYMAVGYYFGKQGQKQQTNGGS